MVKPLSGAESNLFIAECLGVPISSACRKEEIVLQLRISIPDCLNAQRQCSNTVGRGSHDGRAPEVAGVHASSGAAHRAF